MTAGALAPARTEPVWTTALGRSISAGIHASPGAHAKLPAWWGRQHWLQMTATRVTSLINRRGRGEHPILPATVMMVARARAEAADGRTGRSSRLTNERIAELLGMSTRTVQRATRALEAAGVLVCVVPGRSCMTLAQRITAWRNGSSHRKLAAEYALVVPRGVVAQPEPVDDVTPPREALGGSPPPVNRGSSTATDRPTEERLRRTHNQERRQRPVSPAQLRSRRLAAGVQARLGWLRRVSPRRLTSLHRFAQQGWTPRDVQRALDEVLRARDWRVPPALEHPAAYLATLLRDVDENDRPGALEEAMLAAELERRRHRYAVDFGLLPNCPHEMPGGDQPEPGTGRVSCAMCRRAQAR